MSTEGTSNWVYCFLLTFLISLETKRVYGSAVLIFTPLLDAERDDLQDSNVVSLTSNRPACSGMAKWISWSHSVLLLCFFTWLSVKDLITPPLDVKLLRRILSGTKYEYDLGAMMSLSSEQPCLQITVPFWHVMKTSLQN